MPDDFVEGDIKSYVEAASKVIAPLWPISTFAARHPWMGLEKKLLISGRLVKTDS